MLVQPYVHVRRHRRRDRTHLHRRDLLARDSQGAGAPHARSGDRSALGAGGDLLRDTRMRVERAVAEPTLDACRGRARSSSTLAWTSSAMTRRKPLLLELELAEPSLFLAVRRRGTVDDLRQRLPAASTVRRDRVPDASRLRTGRRSGNQGSGVCDSDGSMCCTIGPSLVALSRDARSARFVVINLRDQGAEGLVGTERFLSRLRDTRGHRTASRHSSDAPLPHHHDSQRGGGNDAS